VDTEAAGQFRIVDLLIAHRLTTPLDSSPAAACCASDLISQIDVTRIATASASFLLAAATKSMSLDKISH
jgi:hypothetical protein